MAQTSPSATGYPTALATVIEQHRIHTGRTYRDLADETLIPLTTLHRKMQTGEFGVTDLHRIALAFETTVSALTAEAEVVAEKSAA